jgi:very-short-patch-repair endonuclease
MTSSTRSSAGRPDARIARIASTQASTFSRAQALSVGFSETTMKRRVRTGVWDRVHPGVYRFSGAPPTWHAEIWAALLAVGPLATVTHETALRLHGSDLVAPRPVTLTVPHGGHARVRGVFVHQIDDLRPHHVVSVDLLPVSGAARAIVEASATLGPRQLGRVLDELVFARRTSMAQVAGRLAEVARRGKPGVAKLAAVLDARSDGPVPAGSELERELCATLVGAGLPAPRRQTALPGPGPIEGLVDAAYPDCRVILEADGRRWHTRVEDLARDHARDAQAARAGWLTLRFLYETIVHHPDEVCAIVADVRAVRASVGRAPGVPIAPPDPVHSTESLHPPGPMARR